jgi:hypothetical protein
LTAGDVVTVDNLLNPHPVTATDLDIRNLSKVLDEVYAVLRTDAGVAYDARDRNWTITETLNVGNPPNLDVALSTRASESTLSSVLSQLDITLSSLRDAITAVAPNNKTLADLYERLNSIRTQLDVTLSTRASESTLSSVLAQLDITLSALRDALRGTGNKTLTDLESDLSSILAKLDVALSTRASESKLEAVRALLDSLENALASVGTDKLRTSIIDALPTGTNTIGNVGLSLKGTPNRLYATASGQVAAAPGVGYKLRVYGFYLCNEADEIARLRYGGSTGTVFAVCPSKGVAAMNLLGVNEAGGENQNIYLEKSGTGNTLAVVWTETVAA